MTSGARADAALHRTLQDRLHEARSHAFQGREEEFARLERLLDPESSCRVAFVHGSGGVGKTTLLRAFEARCRERGLRCIRIDGRDTQPTADALRHAVARELGLEGAEPGLASALDAGPLVLILDTFELLRDLEDWIRREFIPELPDDARVCLAGRRAPATDWSVDLGWEPLLDVFELHNFGERDSREFLEKRGVAKPDVPAIQDLTYGHPLALALAVELAGRTQERRYSGEVGRGVLEALLDRFQRDIPDSQHRHALEASAIVRTTTESVLRPLVGVEDASGLFEWLSGLSFIESGPHGVFPHDLVRDALVAELARRDPDRRRELHGRARRYYIQRIQECWDHPIGVKPLELFYSIAFLHRNNPVARFFAWNEQDVFWPGAPRDGDWPVIEDAVHRLEGDDGVRWLRFWAERQPEAAVVVRDREGTAKGFALLPTITARNADEVCADPAASAIWSHLEREAPLRGEESALMTRWWLSLEQLQSVTPESAFLYLHTVGVYLTKPNLAFAVAYFHDSEFWTSAFQYLNYTRIESADFQAGDQTVGAMGIDWRRVPPRDWLGLLFDRELDPEATWAPSEGEALVLARDDFDTAVRDALKSWATPGGLAGNPLTQTHLARGRGEPDAQPEQSVRDEIEAAWEALGRDPANERAKDALRHTYIRPIGTQERVAERMHLPFSTYRRHLQRGIDAIADALWERELVGVRAGGQVRVAPHPI